MKKVVVISCSQRAGSNSDMLADAFADGAKSAGNEVVKISLAGKQINFCRGCLACQTATAHCVIKDDAGPIGREVMNADVVVWATPIYYYEMSGQMKTLIDRMNPMYCKDYKFRDVYMLCCAADDSPKTPSRAIAGLEGWIECFEKSRLAGTVFCGGVNSPKDIAGSKKLKEAFEMGKRV